MPDYDLDSLHRRIPFRYTERPDTLTQQINSGALNYCNTTATLA